MTKTQERMIKNIKDYAKSSFMYGENYEFKKFDVTETEYFVSVVFEIGAIGDEGTLASVFCRDGAQIFIGKRGGLSYVNGYNRIVKCGLHEAVWSGFRVEQQTKKRIKKIGMK